MEALESDQEFRKKLDKAPEADIRVSTLVESELCRKRSRKLLIKSSFYAR